MVYGVKIARNIGGYSNDIFRLRKLLFPSKNPKFYYFSDADWPVAFAKSHEPVDQHTFAQCVFYLL